jgi:MoxR-like ATPase
LDEAKALYEWDYARQMLYAQLLRDMVASQTASATSISDAVDRIAGADAAFFSARFLVERPILQALRSPTPALLLIDEVDRAEPEFEALLLEVLAENQVTIPEIGAIAATHPPFVLLTSNGTREMSDALRRRCLHAFVDYPHPSREQAILELRVPGLGADLAAELTRFAVRVRSLELRKAPSVAEMIDWARAIVVLGASALDPEVARTTLGVLLKYADDRARVEANLPTLLGS